MKSDFERAVDGYEKALLTYGNSSHVVNMECVAEARAKLMMYGPDGGGRDTSRVLLNAARGFAVLFLAFEGRDRGTERMGRTLDGLAKVASALDDMISAELEK